MKKYFKKIKLELFFFRRMIGRRASPREFYQYVKNRFFGARLAKRFPKFSCGPIDPDLEVHILSQKSMLWPMMVLIRSFLHHSGLCPRVVVHVEEEFDQAAMNLLESKFDNVTVIPWREATARIAAMSNIPESIKRYRFGSNIIVVKLIDGYLLSKARYIMVVGTDVLFYNKPTEMVDLVRGATPDLDALASPDPHTYILKVDPEYVARHHVVEQGLNRLNSDLLIFDKTKVPLERFIEYFAHITDPHDYFLDMTGFVMLFAQMRSQLLPHERYRIKGGVTDDTVTKQFTSPRRDEFYSYGIDLALKKMGL